MRTTITQLKNVEVFAKQARIDAQAAVERLTGARKARAEQVVDMLAEAARYAWRLAFVIMGNVRAEEVAEARRLVNPAWAAIKTEGLMRYAVAMVALMAAGVWAADDDCGGYSCEDLSGHH